MCSGLRKTTTSSAKSGIGRAGRQPWRVQKPIACGDVVQVSSRHRLGTSGDHVADECLELGVDRLARLAEHGLERRGGDDDGPVDQPER